MATQTLGSDDGTLNGTTPVTLVPAPAASHQIAIKSIIIMNRDTASATVTVNKVSAGGTRQISKSVLATDQTLVIDSLIILDDTGSSITAVMSGAAATTNPDWLTNWIDNT